MHESLDLLLDDGVIDEILGRLKSGKEANVYFVRKGEQVLAAKVYKDRSQRSFKSNADYKEGRKTRNSRTQRAIESGGRFGRAAEEQAWKATEASALQTLHARGVRVPRPVMFYEGVLLMELVLDTEGCVAPRLIDVALEPAAARALYLELRAQIIGLLCCEIIHGDLSPYNILAAADGPTIIDFPQIVSAAHNSRAEFFFQRDFQNLLDYVAAADRGLAAHVADGRAIWRAYVQRELTPDFVPPPPHPPRDVRGPGRARHPAPRNDGRRPDGSAPHVEARRPGHHAPRVDARGSERAHRPEPRRADERAQRPEPRRPDERAQRPEPRRPDERAHRPEPRRADERAHRPEPRRADERAQRPEPRRADERAQRPEPRRADERAERRFPKPRQPHGPPRRPSS